MTNGETEAVTTPSIAATEDAATTKAKVPVFDFYSSSPESVVAPNRSLEAQWLRSKKRFIVPQQGQLARILSIEEHRQLVVTSDSESSHSARPSFDSPVRSSFAASSHSSPRAGAGTGAAVTPIGSWETSSSFAVPVQPSQSSSGGGQKKPALVHDEHGNVVPAVIMLNRTRSASTHTLHAQRQPRSQAMRRTIGFSCSRPPSPLSTSISTSLSSSLEDDPLKLLLSSTSRKPYASVPVSRAPSPLQCSSSLPKQEVPSRRKAASQPPSPRPSHLSLSPSPRASSSVPVPLPLGSPFFPIPATASDAIPANLSTTDANKPTTKCLTPIMSAADPKSIELPLHGPQRRMSASKGKRALKGWRSPDLVLASAAATNKVDSYFLPHPSPTVSTHSHKGAVVVPSTPTRVFEEMQSRSAGPSPERKVKSASATSSSPQRQSEKQKQKRALGASESTSSAISTATTTSTSTTISTSTSSSSSTASTCSTNCCARSNSGTEARVGSGSGSGTTTTTTASPSSPTHSLPHSPSHSRSSHSQSQSQSNSSIKTQDFARPISSSPESFETDERAATSKKYALPRLIRSIVGLD